MEGAHSQQLHHITVKVFSRGFEYLSGAFTVDFLIFVVKVVLDIKQKKKSGLPSKKYGRVGD